jgi:hypothetical protein
MAKVHIDGVLFTNDLEMLADTICGFCGDVYHHTLFREHAKVCSNANGKASYKPKVNREPVYKPSAILRFFEWEHLPDDGLQQVSKMFAEIAKNMDFVLPDGPEKSVTLRKLLEAKDAAVRAALPKV